MLGPAAARGTGARPAVADVGRRRAEDAVTRGLLEADAHAAGRAVLTDRGRLLADALVRDLTD